VTNRQNSGKLLFTSIIFINYTGCSNNLPDYKYIPLIGAPFYGTRVRGGKNVTGLHKTL